MYSDVFIHSIDKGYLGFQFEGSMKSAAMNNIVDPFLCIYMFISIETYLGVYLRLGSPETKPEAKS